MLENMMLPDAHTAALMWFKQRTGKVVLWRDIQEHAQHGPRLVTQAKGIYKPAVSEYALSVRQTLDSPYADKEVVFRPDGSWLYPYFQENPDPNKREQEATNRGLMKCMRDGVPVGVLLQTKGKPGVEYRVLGLARVTDWRKGYFILESEGALVAGTKKLDGTDAGMARALAATEPHSDDFDSSDKVDRRARVVAEVVRRRGQPQFRKALLSQYGGRCVMSGCDAPEALEAAHITPYMGDKTNHVQNGLLLRADLHALFDLGLIGVNPDDFSIVVAPSLATGFYGELAGRKIGAPQVPELAPNREALAQHFAWAGLQKPAPSHGAEAAVAAAQKPPDCLARIYRTADTGLLHPSSRISAT